MADNQYKPDEFDESSNINQSTDLTYSIQELFKDKTTDNGRKSDIDLRTRLSQRNVWGLSVINFLQNVENKEIIKGSRSYIDSDDNKICSMAESLEHLGMSFKRHLVSKEGMGRQEVVQLFKADLENKKQTIGSKIFAPQ